MMDFEGKELVEKRLNAFLLQKRQRESGQALLQAVAAAARNERSGPVDSN